MGVYKEGKNWKVQVYYKDWQGNQKRKQKRGFRTKGEAKEWERDSFSSRARKWISNLGTSWKSTIRICMSDFGNTPCIQSVTSLT